MKAWAARESWAAERMKSKMAVTKKTFGTLADGRVVDLYTIQNASGAKVSIQTLGGGIQSIYVPDRSGVLGDVVLGFDAPQPYTDPDLGYQGLLVGPVANRIKYHSFELDGVTYDLPNNQGAWTLHSGGRFSFNLWQAEISGDNSVTVSFFSPDGEDGFPGDFKMQVQYTFSDDNVLRLDYTATSTKKTFVNMTNHSYFNLSGRAGTTIESHDLMIAADYCTETDGDQLPTGKLFPVSGTPMDFTTLHKVGDKIDEPFSQLIDGIGYDNNYCLRKPGRTFGLCARLEEETSGRVMEVWTDLPGVQLYCGGWLEKAGSPGKASNGAVTYRRGLALETQFYPDTPHNPNFPPAIMQPGEAFTTATEFRFGVRS